MNFHDYFALFIILYISVINLSRVVKDVALYCIPQE